MTSSLVRGNIMVLALLFAGIFMTVGTALVGYVTSYGRLERTSIASSEALAIAEGALDNAMYQLNQNVNYSGENGTALGAGTFTITVTAIDSKTKRITATGSVPNSGNPIATKTIKATLAISDAVISFHYGVQAGQGGFTLANSSEIIGNVFANGPVVGGQTNYIYGDVVSAGAGGLVYGIHATSSVYAHTIGQNGSNTIVDKDAYYTTKVNTTVNGANHPGSTDQATAPLPISDGQIGGWETQAASGGTISTCDNHGDYTISSNMTLGPKKITCNLVVKSSSGVLNVTGPIWVTGNITTQTGPTIRMDPSLGSENVAIIADNPADTTGSGVITVGQSTVFEGSGAPGSFVFLISQNNSAEGGGSNTALSMSQGASALVAYAAHGLATLSQSVNVKEVTAYQINLSQSASVTYDSGLPSTVFQAGPGGSWSFAKGSYAITQ